MKMSNILKVVFVVGLLLTMSQVKASETYEHVGNVQFGFQNVTDYVESITCEKSPLLELDERVCTIKLQQRDIEGVLVIENTVGVLWFDEFNTIEFD